MSGHPGAARITMLTRQGGIMLFFVAVIGITQGDIFAQGQKPSFFVGVPFTSNKANASIEAYDGSTQCGVFQNGNGDAPSLFGGITFPLGSPFSIDAKLEYDNLSTSFNIPASPIVKNTPLAFNLFTNTYDTIWRNRLYEASLGMAGAAVLLSYSILPRLNVSAGPFLGLLVRHSYNETEALVYPADSTARYKENGLSTRTIGSDKINNVNLLQAGMELSASYELPFEPHLALRPSIGATIPFTSITSLLSVYSIGGSITLVYHFSEPEPMPAIANKMETPQAHTGQPVTMPTASTPLPKHAVLEVSINALGVSDDGHEVPEPVLTIERTHVTEVYPMLHYVFFGDGSSTIPERYHLETPQTRESFNEKNLYTDNALEIHHHVLDIIGKRLSENPEASITLVGARSEHSPGDSAHAQTISMDRARTVQNYLATVWGISRDRIRLRARALPEAASDDHNPFGEAENRRVEIIPSTPDITAPLWTEHIERVATPPRIDFVPSITTAEKVGIRSATITVLQHGHLLRTIDALSDSAVSEYRWTIDDRSMPEEAAGPSDSLTYLFTAVDSLNDTARATGVIHLWQKALDITKHESDTEPGKQVERYSLILFDYSSSQLDKTESERIVSDMASEIQSQTRVTLTGHTDQTGDDAFNDELSRDRAMQAAQMLKAELTQVGKPEPSIAVEWRGSHDELFDNSIPEGRVLSRTVRAIVENSTK